MRKLQLAVAALALSGTMAFAQGGGGGGGGGGQGRGMNQQAMMDAMMKDITLSADQKTKVDSIVKTYADMNAAVRADQNLDQQARRAKMTENRTKQNDEIKAVLTDDQKKVFDKNLADMAARMQQRPPTA